MERWRRDLYILWVCNFIIQVGFSLIMPFLPLYLEQLHVPESGVDMWSGVIFSANFIVMALVAPMWGSLSDRFGRKPMMLRSAFGMGLVVWLMALVNSPWQLLGLRLLQGFSSGFIPAVTAYMASTAPVERSGYALGILTTGTVGGNVLGPLVGGVLAEAIGYRPIFYLTSLSCMVTGAMVLFLIKEQFTPIPRQAGQGFASDLAVVKRYPIVIAMSVVLFMNMFSIQTAEPVISHYLQSLQAPERWVELLSGLTFSVTGVATILVAPRMGKLSDRIGSRRVLAICLSGAAVMYVMQGLVIAAWQLVATRFVLGLFTGGLMPAANGLIARSIARNLQGRIFGVTNSAISLGAALGPLVGGGIGWLFGTRSIFPATGTLLFLDLLWVLASVKGEVIHKPQAKAG